MIPAIEAFHYELARAVIKRSPLFPHITEAETHRLMPYHYREVEFACGCAVLWRAWSGELEYPTPCLRHAIR
jgi:hypothetical protein